MPTQIEMESQVAILRIWTELERDDSEALENVATCRPVLHNRVAKVCLTLPDMTNSMVGFDANVAVVEPEQIEEVDSIKSYKGGTETGDAKDQ